MPQVRSLERRPSDPTPEQIRLKCAQIRATWAVTGDKRHVPEPRATSTSACSAKADW